MAAPRVFEVVVPDSIWVTERPVWFSGVRMRARTTVVRLAGGALWVHSPAVPTAEVCAELDALGEVRWIVVPNRFHHLQAPATAARYPNAAVVGPKTAQARNPLVNPSLTAHDLLISASARDHWTWRTAARIWGRYGKIKTPPDVRWNTRASTAAAESIAQLSALPLERILVAHADPITDRPVRQLNDAWRFAIPSELRSRGTHSAANS